MKHNTLLIVIGATAMAMCGCKSSHDDHHGAMHSGSSSEKGAGAVATLNPTVNNHAHGKVTFTRVSDGVRVVAVVEGLTPGKHGFHIHEKGDCSAPDGMSAGGHFNPGHAQHGAPNSTQRHAGDFGNITADDKGVAHYEAVDKNIQLDGPDTIIGRAVIVHGKEDDLTSQPAGNAGPRVACGVIEKK